MTMLALSAAALYVSAEGLRVRPDNDLWPRWQARIGVTTSPTNADMSAPSVQATRLFGDYYFSGPGFGAGGVSGGFRATSGLFAGPRSQALSTPTLPARQGSPFTLTTRPGPQALLADVSEGNATVPYLGVGYTGMSERGGWGFTADVGVMGADVRLGRSTVGSQNNVDELLRELRLTPVLQLGVSYSF
jgi:hypothetical protein